MKPVKYIKNYIGGNLVPADSGNYLDNSNPATGEIYSHVPDSNAVDVQKAVEAAERALPDWSKGSEEKRVRLLTRLADIIEQNLDDFAYAESLDSGKPLSMSKSVDIPNAHTNLRFFATAILHFVSESHRSSHQVINYTLRQPIGIVGCISPGNLPLYLLTWKIAPALAAGNCVVAKPSELTPMTAHLLAQACQAAGIPDGVLNIVHGSPKVAQAIAENPKIKAVSFTGSTSAGREIAKLAAPMFKKVSLEMSGKNPNIIFADCDFDKMIFNTLRSSFSNNGQLSLCGPRIFVERPLYEKFKEEFVKRTQFLKVGDPFSPISDLGSLVSSQHLEKVMSYVELAKVEGGMVLCGGQAMDMSGALSKGNFFKPTVIEGLSPYARTNQEEIFGPVVTITPFDTKEEALEYANAIDFGLSATVWTKDAIKANYMAEHLDVGIVWLNCWQERDLRIPFGGNKNSGLGRSGGMEALRFFTQTKNICVKY